MLYLESIKPKGQFKSVEKELKWNIVLTSCSKNLGTIHISRAALRHFISTECLSDETSRTPYLRKTASSIIKENPHFSAREGKEAAAAKASSEASLVSTGSSSQI